MIHERVSQQVFEAMGIWDEMLAGDVTFAAWEGLYAPIFGGVALLVLVLLFRHRRLHPISFWAGLAAIGVWGVALTMEFVGLTFLTWSRYWLQATSNVEEAAEILGSTLFLLAVALVLRSTAGWDRRTVTATDRAMLSRSP